MYNDSPGGGGGWLPEEPITPPPPTELAFYVNLGKGLLLGCVLAAIMLLAIADAIIRPRPKHIKVP